MEMEEESPYTMIQRILLGLGLSQTFCENYGKNYGKKIHNFGRPISRCVHHVVVVVGLAVCFAVVNDVPEPLGRWVDVV